ncbi:MAG: hypothetical protein AAF483_10490 [Planctomycetota bacterium]
MSRTIEIIEMKRGKPTLRSFPGQKPGFAKARDFGCLELEGY